MGYPRAFIVDPEEPGFYHCISPCIRRAGLCGDNPLSGRNFDHRRAWIEHRLISLADSFAVGLFAWAVMSNHSHWRSPDTHLNNPVRSEPCAFTPDGCPRCFL